MLTDPEITKMIIKAIPAEECPVKNSGAMNRREVLEKRFNEYIANLKKQYEQPATTEPNY